MTKGTSNNDAQVTRKTSRTAGMKRRNEIRVALKTAWLSDKLPSIDMVVALIPDPHMQRLLRSSATEAYTTAVRRARAAKGNPSTRRLRVFSKQTCQELTKIAINRAIQTARRYIVDATAAQQQPGKVTHTAFPATV